MKKLLSLLLTLALLMTLGVSAFAENGEADVPFDGEADEETEIPEELVGFWKGDGMPKNGKTPVALEVEIRADGTGEYRFTQDDYQESNPITLIRDGNRFSVDTAASQFSECGGTWALEDGVLTLDISSNLPDGRVFSYTASLVKQEEEPWPSNGEIWRASGLGKKMELTVEVNQPSDTGMHIKIYWGGTDLFSMLFIGGTGNATTRLPGGSYTIKDGTGKTWYGPDDSFGPAGDYEVMTFDDGSSLVTLDSGYAYTITINDERDSPNADSVGSEATSYSSF